MTAMTVSQRLTAAVAVLVGLFVLAVLASVGRTISTAASTASTKKIGRAHV